MEKLLRPKDIILLGLAVLGDLYFDITEPVSIQLGKMKGALPPDYSVTNFYCTVSRMYRTKEIKRVIINGEAYLELTGSGKRSLQRKFPLLAMQNQKWDRLWRVVIFDIEEKDRKTRELLRIKLKELGFGMWQKSVYLSPFNVAKDIREFLVANDLSDQVCVLISQRLYAGNERELASKVWPLDQINEDYEELIDRWEGAKIKLEKQKLTKEAQLCYQDYLKVVTVDPFLPRELLANDWLGFKIKKYLREWYKLLS